LIFTKKQCNPLTIVKPYLIAKIVINHNVDIKIAKQLIQNAKECAFDSVKFQKNNKFGI